jgi:hypothetical protein
MDLSKLSDADLMALQANDLSKVSNEGLQHLHSELQSAQHPNMHMEQGDWVMNAPAKSPTGKPITDVIGNLWDESKLSGLAPEVSPIGGATRIGGYRGIQAVNKAGNAIEDIVAAAKGSTIGQKLGNALKELGDTAKGIAQIPQELMPSNIQNGYALAKAKSPYLFREFAAGKLEGMTPEAEAHAKKSGVFNYAKAIFGQDINKNEAENAKNYADVWKQKALADELMKKAQGVGGRGNYTLPENASLMLPEGVQVSPGQFTGNAARQIGNEATWFPNAATLGDFLKTKSHLLGVLSSPRINTNLGYAAGKIGNAYEMLPQASVEDLINAGLLDARTMRANQGEQ